MGQVVEMPISGTVTASVKVNIRQGAPSVQSPVLRKLSPGTTIPVQALVVGDNVQGNAHWYRTSDNAYAWAGAFLPLQSESDNSDTSTGQQDTSGDVIAGIDQVPLVV